MPTIIDSLVVQLGLDSSNFVTEQKKAILAIRATEEQAQRSAAGLERSGGQGAAFFNTMKGAALGLSSVLAGLGLKNLAIDAINTGSQTKRLADNLVMSTTEITKWGAAIEHIAGGSTEGFAATLQNLSQQFEGLSEGQMSSVIPFFRLLGIQITDTHGKIKPTVDILLELNKAVQGMDPRRANYRLAGAGITDQGTRNLLINSTPAQLQKELAYQAARHATSDADAIKLRDAHDAIADLTTDFSKLGQELTVAAIPQIRAFTAGLKDVTDWLSGRIRFSDIGKSQAERDADKTEPSWTSDPILMGRKAADALNGITGVGDPNAAPPRSLLDRLKRYLPDRLNQPAQSPFSPSSSSGVPEEGRALLKTLALDESGGDYHKNYGGAHVDDLSQHPNIRVPIPGKPGLVSSAFGAYQMLKPTWDTLARDMGLKDISPDNQDRAAWELAKRTYGPNLQQDLAGGNPATLARIAHSLHSQWTSAPGGEEQGQNAGSFVARLAATLKRAVVPTAQAAEGGADATGYSSAVTNALGNLRRPQPTPSAADRGATGDTTSNSGNTTIHVGDVHVSSAAKDAKGIAKDIGGSLRLELAPQLNRGLA